MIYLLDTNACIHHLKFADSPVTRKLATHLPETAVCSVTKAELFYGAMRNTVRLSPPTPSPSKEATVYTQITKTINFLVFAPLAPQFWGELIDASLIYLGTRGGGQNNFDFFRRKHRERSND